jgi:hypothetical protein
MAVRKKNADCIPAIAMACRNDEHNINEEEYVVSGRSRGRAYILHGEWERL